MPASIQHDQSIVRGLENVDIARSAADAPEIDGLVYIENTGHLKVGEFLTVEIIDSDAHDLRGRILEKDERI